MPKMMLGVGGWGLGVGKTTLKILLEEKIEETGSLNFAEFMEIALYHPELGYYSKNQTSQDYYTNVDVHPIFSEILARFFLKEWQTNWRGGPGFKIIELGPGNGKLCRRILSWIQNHSPEFYGSLEYVCVERSALRRQACESLIQEFCILI